MADEVKEQATDTKTLSDLYAGAESTREERLRAVEWINKFGPQEWAKLVNRTTHAQKLARKAKQ